MTPPQYFLPFFAQLSIKLVSTNMNFPKLLLLLTTVSTGLIAGLFYAWSVSVTVGLGKLSAIEHLRAFQSLNREIQNPAFFLTFMGTAILLPLSTFWEFRSGVMPIFWLLISASAAYLIGVMVVTIFGNIPLNEAIDTLNLSEMPDLEVQNKRQLFENQWNRFNWIRTWSSLLAFGLCVWACLIKDRI